MAAFFPSLLVFRASRLFNLTSTAPLRLTPLLVMYSSKASRPADIPATTAQPLEQATSTAKQPAISARMLEKLRTAPKNEKINASNIILIGADGKNQGAHSLSSAIKTAKELGMDVVLLDQTSTPPICRMMEPLTAKAAFDNQKRTKDAKAKSTGSTTPKEFEIKPNIGPNDLDIKIAKMEQLLAKGHRIHVYLIEIRRDNEQKALAVLSKLKEKLSASGNVKQEDTSSKQRYKLQIEPRR